MQRAIHPDESICEAIVDAVASVTDRDPLDLQPIAETLDPGAVDALFVRSAGRPPQRLELVYEGCSVEVDRDRISVVELQQA